MPDETERVSRADIEAKLREIRGEVDEASTSAKPYALAAGVAVAVAVVAIAYVLGRRAPGESLLARGPRGREVFCA